MQKFRCSFLSAGSGILKLWLNGEPMVDAWRQNWLPWIHQLRLPMKPGKRYPIKIEWIPTGGTIGEGKGDFPGMLTTRTFEIVWISKRKPAGLDFSAKPDAVVTYDGNPQTIRMR